MISKAGSYSYSIFGIFFLILMFPTVAIFDLDFAEKLQSLEKYEIDELVIPLLILIGCIAIDVVRRKERLHFHQKIDEQENQIARSNDSLKSLQIRLSRLRNTAIDNNESSEIVSLCEKALDQCNQSIIETDAK